MARQSIAAGISRRLNASCTAHLLREIIEDTRLQHHVHEDGADDPAQLALPHVQHALDAPGPLAAKFIVAPGVLGDTLDVALEQGEAHKV